MVRQQGGYGEKWATIVVEFEAEGRYIKLGETSIDIG